MATRLRSTNEQREYLVERCCTNPLLQTFKGPLSHKAWFKLREDLNRLGPPFKSVMQWRMTWKDLKRKAQVAAAKRKRAEMLEKKGVIVAIPNLHESQWKILKYLADVEQSCKESKNKTSQESAISMENGDSLILEVSSVDDPNDATIEYLDESFIDKDMPDHNYYDMKREDEISDNSNADDNANDDSDPAQDLQNDDEIMEKSYIKQTRFNHRQCIKDINSKIKEQADTIDITDELENLYPAWLKEVEQKRAHSELMRAKVEVKRVAVEEKNAEAATTQAQAMKAMAEAAVIQARAAKQMAEAATLQADALMRLATFVENNGLPNFN